MTQIPSQVLDPLLADLAAARSALTPEAQAAFDRMVATADRGPAALPARLAALPEECKAAAERFAAYLAAYGAAHPNRPNTVAILIRRQLQETHEAADEHRRPGVVDPRAVRLERVNAPALYATARVSTFATDAPTAPERYQLERLKKWAVDYVRAWPRRQVVGTVPLIALITGPSGNGKTHLAWALASAIATEHDGYPLVVTAGDLLDDVRDAFGRDRGEAGVGARLDRYRRADFLAIDDLSRHAVRGDPSSILFDVLNDREREGRPTLLTTNETLETLEAWLGVAIMERVLQWRAVHEVNVPSYRVRRVALGGAE